MKANPLPQDSSNRRLLIFAAWISILLISDLPDIVWDAYLGPPPDWMIWVKLGFLLLFFTACRTSKILNPLRHYALIMSLFFIGLATVRAIRESSSWQDLFNGSNPSFTFGYTGIYLLDIGVALVVIWGLWYIKRARRDFFLVKGEIDAPTEQVRWLGIPKGESWRKVGWIFASVSGVVVAFPTLLLVHFSTEILQRAAPLIPAVLIFAAINAFTEEIYFRVSLLATLPEVIGKSHALLINVVFFGLAHYLYGSPSGVAGFMMTGFLAWFLGKSILETRGIFWAWLIHFVPDVVIFASYALAWVQR